MKQITIGRYISGDSFIHKLNPFVKLSINVIFIVLIFITKNLFLMSFLFSLAILSFLISGLKKTQMIKILLPVVFIGAFIFMINMLLFEDGYGTHANGSVDYESVSARGHWDSLFYQTWKITISDRVIIHSIFIMLRIYIMIVVTTLLTATTKPTALTKSIEDLLFPLKFLFVPVHIIAMIISIALRFIPTLLSEAQRIIKAQASRGVDFKNGSFKSKIKSMITLIIPLFVSAFSKAEDLGQAMETRGYDPYEKRTRYRKYSFTWRDLLVCVVVILVIVTIALMKNQVFILPIWWV